MLRAQSFDWILVGPLAVHGRGARLLMHSEQPDSWVGAGAAGGWGFEHPLLVPYQLPAKKTWVRWLGKSRTNMHLFVCVELFKMPWGSILCFVHNEVIYHCR